MSWFLLQLRRVLITPLILILVGMCIADMILEVIVTTITWVREGQWELSRTFTFTEVVEAWPKPIRR